MGSRQSSGESAAGPCVVLLGAPGAGKGTQATLLCRRAGLRHLSTGDLLRAEIASGSELGRQVQAIVEGGNLVPDEVVARVVGENVSRGPTRSGVLFDGFPRTVGQARLLEEMLAARGLPPAVVLELEVPEADVVSRLASRRSCPAHGPRPAGETTCAECGGELALRRDDRPEVVSERLRVYHEKTRPLSDWYEERGVLRRVSGLGDPEAVADRAEAALRELTASQDAP
jgi:adenylate kinase